MIKRYLFNLLIGLDQLLNTVMGGDPDETVSSRLGRLREANGGAIPWTRPLSRVIAWGLDKIDKGHCTEAIEHDEGKDGVVDRPKKGSVA